jgi:class 3 adenylate cyclase
MAEERRVVTILFADVAGSTALGEQLDPEDARALLRRYYEIARDTVTEYGGILEKFIGDAVVAVFGFPQTHDDDPERALSAASVLRDRVRADAVLSERLPIRIGINTGEVVAARESATGDFPLTGDAVNVAARLQTAAEPWGILAGERTVTSAAGAFEFGPRLDVEARGKTQPVVAYSLLGRSGRRRVKSHTALVGRDADLQQLELVARRALLEARPFLVSIIAPAGIGKTRLLEEFIERLPSIEPRAVVAVAQSLPYGQRLTYWPLRSVLYRLIKVPDDAMGQTVRQAIRSWLEGTSLEAIDREVELLAATIGAGESEVSDRSAMLVAWRTFFEIAARRQPLVLVFEDLHWSSDSLLDLFEFVMQPRGDLPLLMIALTRPELLDRRPGWGGGRRNYVSIALEPLNDDDTARLVRQLMDDCSTNTVRQIVEHADGNPFFAGELIRSVCERPDSHRLPDTVQATVLARLDLLPPHERRAIQLGSVFGRSFRQSGVQALEPNLPRLAEALDRLVEKDLLRPSARLPQAYTFRHILIREVAYQTLTRSERAQLHGSAAAWMEANAHGREESLAEMIAYHYREAATIATAQRPNDPDSESLRQKAVGWLGRAADTAGAAAATGEGARHLRSAIELAQQSELPELFERLGDMGESAEVTVPAYRTALRLAREQGRTPEQELRIMTGLLSIYTRTQGSVADRLSDAEMDEFRREARAVAERVQDEAILARYLAADAFYPFWLIGTREIPADEMTQAMTSAQHALAIGQRLDDPNLESAALDALASLAQIEGSWEKAREYSRSRLGFQDRLSTLERVDAEAMVTWCSAVLGDLDDAERSSAEGLARIMPGQIPAWLFHLVSWRTYVLTLLGRWDEALQVAERGRQLWLESGKPAAGYAAGGLMAAIDVAEAREENGAAAAQVGVLDAICLAFPEDRPFRRYLAYGAKDFDSLQRIIHDWAVRPNVGPADRGERILNRFLDAGRVPDLGDLEQWLTKAERRGLRVIEAQIRRGLGLGHRDPQELGRALAIFERIGARPYAARVLCERAILTGNQHDRDQGLAILDELGDRVQLSRLERLHVG